MARHLSTMKNRALVFGDAPLCSSSRCCQSNGCFEPVLAPRGIITIAVRSPNCTGRWMGDPRTHSSVPRRTIPAMLK